MDPQLADPLLRRFAAVVVHELRTPLFALSGEVEVALRRDRLPADCRAMLERVGGLVADLTDLSRDLAIYADLTCAELFGVVTCRLSECLDQAALRHRDVISVALDDITRERLVTADRSLLTRALSLLLHHAVRHCPDDAAIRVSSLSQAEAIGEMLVLVIEAHPGFEPQVWAPLPGASEQTPIEQAAMFRLPTAARIIEACGGSVDVQCWSGSAAVRIRFPLAQP